MSCAANDLKVTFSRRLSEHRRSVSEDGRAVVGPLTEARLLCSSASSGRSGPVHKEGVNAAIEAGVFRGLWKVPGKHEVIGLIEVEDASAGNKRRWRAFPPVP